MPYEAFFKLPQEKQNKIISCAYKEFGENFYDKASIFLIAKKAGISRASLYCYFADKEDIFKYLASQILKPHIENIKSKNSLHPFQVSKQLFDYFMSFYNKPEQNFIIALLKNMTPKYIKYLTNDLSKNHFSKPCELIFDASKLDLKTQYDTSIISFTIVSNMALCLIQYFEGIKTKEDALMHFNRTLQILENEFLKRRIKYDTN